MYAPSMYPRIVREHYHVKQICADNSVSPFATYVKIEYCKHKTKHATILFSTRQLFLTMRMVYKHLSVKSLNN